MPAGGVRPAGGGRTNASDPLVFSAAVDDDAAVACQILSSEHASGGSAQVSLNGPLRAVAVLTAAR
jgi:hypothetical protein